MGRILHFSLYVAVPVLFLGQGLPGAASVSRLFGSLHQYLYYLFAPHLFPRSEWFHGYIRLFGHLVNLRGSTVWGIRQHRQPGVGYSDRGAGWFGWCYEQMPDTITGGGLFNYDSLWRDGDDRFYACEDWATVRQQPRGRGGPSQPHRVSRGHRDGLQLLARTIPLLPFCAGRLTLPHPKRPHFGACTGER